MAKLKWTAFAHPSKSFVYAGDSLKKNWAKLHRGDCDWFLRMRGHLTISAE